MRTIRAVRYGSLPSLLDGVITECFAVRMLTEPNSLRLSVKEPDHSMLPVPYMVINSLLKHGRSVVVCIEIHIECIDGSATVVVDDDTMDFHVRMTIRALSKAGPKQRVAVSGMRDPLNLRSANSPICLAIAVRFHAFEPGRIGRDIVQ